MNPSKDIRAYEEVAGRLADASSILVFAGSGLSVESGVPTFRGPNGAYSDPSIARYVHVQTFHDDRKGMMGWYDELRGEIRKVWPNAGHYALATLGKDHPLYVATQNVDGLLQQAMREEDADFPVIRLHGALDADQCHHCRNVFHDTVLSLADGPACRVCKGPLRPAVTWFGEDLPTGAYEDALEAAGRADVCLIVGTSGLVYPAAQIPDIAKESGAWIVEVNPNESELSELADLVLRESAALALPRIVDVLHHVHG